MATKERPLSKLPKADRDLVSAAVAAVEAGRAPVLRELLPSLRDRGLVDYGGAVTMHHTLLQLAVHKGRVPIVVLLLDAGADIEGHDYRKRTPLMNGVAEPELCELLLARGARVDSRDTYDETAMHIAAHDVRAKGEVVRILLAAGADANAIGNAGRTALHHAAASGSVENVRLLLAAGADASASAQGQQGTPLSYLEAVGARMAPDVREAIVALLSAATGTGARKC